MEYYDFKVFTRVLWQFTAKFAPLTCVNRGETPASGWIHLKVGIQCVLLRWGQDPKEEFSQRYLDLHSSVSTTGLKAHYNGCRISVYMANRGQRLLRGAKV